MKCIVNKRNIIKYCIILIACGIGTAAFNSQYFSNEWQLTAVLCNILVFLLIGILINVLWDNTDKRNLLIGYGTGIIFATSLVVGKSVYETNSLWFIFGSVKGVFISVFIVCGLAILFGSIFCQLLKLSDEKRKEHSVGVLERFFFHKKLTVLKMQLIILGTYLCFYIAYAPGTLAYDYVGQLKEAIGEMPLSQYNPTVHTLFIRLCVFIGSAFSFENAWLVCYSLIQMIVMSIIFAVTIYILIGMNINKKIILGALIFYALCPVNAIFSFVTAKDVFAAGFFLLVTLYLYKMFVNTKLFFSKIINPILLCVFILMTCLLRNNVIYAMLLFAPILLFVFSRKDNRMFLVRVAIVVFAPLMAFYFITIPFFSWLGIVDGPMTEALSVPIQQVARVVVEKEDELSDVEKESIGKFLKYSTVKEKFNPRLADPVKNRVDIVAISEDGAGFVNIWKNLFVRYPGVYADAFLSLNLPLWYIDAPWPDIYSKRVYIETYPWAEPNEPMRIMELEPLHNFYQGFANYNTFNKIPVASKVFLPAFTIWMIFITVAILIYKKRYELLPVCIIAFLLWLTLMAGPVTNMRYVYPLFVMYPLFVVFWFQPKVARFGKKNQQL